MSFTLAPATAPTIRMSNAATGAEAYANIFSYREVWYAKGWRSEDDPAFVGVGPRTVLTPWQSQAEAYQLLPDFTDSSSNLVDTSVAGQVGVRRSVSLPLYRATSISNTTTETSLLNASATTIDLTTEDRNVLSVLRLQIAGVISSSASTPNGTFRINVTPNTGGVVPMTFLFSAIPNSASTRSWYLDVTMGFQSFIGIRNTGFGRVSVGGAGGGADLSPVTRHADTTNTYALASAIAVTPTFQWSAALSTSSLSVTTCVLTRSVVDA